MSSMIIINGKRYVGNNVTVKGNDVYIDGKKQFDHNKEPKIEIKIEGLVDNLQVDTCDTITVNGNVQTLSSVNGDVVCGNVLGNVTNKNGDIDCENVNGDVSTKNGDINKN